MKKYEMIKKNKAFSIIINDSNKKYLKNRYFSIYYQKNNLNYNRYGISVPTKTGNAVLRNKIKRQIKNIIDQNNIQKSYDYVIIIKKDILELNYLEKEKSFLVLINKIGEKNEE